jgi:hypothetical protein
MTSASILAYCPCCEAQLTIDLNTGEVFTLAEPQIATEEPRNSGISVVHATPEFFQYRDPTHQPRQRMLQSIAPLPAEPVDDVEFTYEEASPDLIHRTNTAHFQDLKNRYLL